MARSAAVLVAVLAALALLAGPGFVSSPAAREQREAGVATRVLRNNQFEDMTAYDAPRRKPNFNGIRTGLSDLLKPLNSEYGVTAKEDSPATYVVLVFAIVMLFLF
ncbi:unnamed protein product, partial [Prorocentrum cordatum]